MGKIAPAGADLAQKLAKLNADYREKLPGELAKLRELFAQLGSRADIRVALRELHHGLHKLAGSGGTFGLHDLSKSAKLLESKVQFWIDSGYESVPRGAAEEFARQLGEMCVLGVGQPDAKTTSLVLRQSLEVIDSASVWLVADDEVLAADLKQQMESYNFRVETYRCLADADSAARDGSPNILLIDVKLSGCKVDTTSSLAGYSKLRSLTCPLIFISDFDDLATRIWAARMGAVGYYLKPMHIPSLVGMIMELIGEYSAPAQRVLIVDDDVELAEHYRLVLGASGMEVDVLRNPEDILQRISAFQPELVLIDMEMPQYFGPDLAAVVRQHERWSSLPIVYLSAETNLMKQMDALRRGADDFLTKPIGDAQLVVAVYVRIQRARHLEALISKDSLTGLLKHAGVKDAAEREIAGARRRGSPCSVAMMDIDHFKAVNDRYGHAVGDIVISSVAMLLRQRMRKADVVGRYGGEEFVVVMQDCSAEQAYIVMEDIRRRFSSLKFGGREGEFFCTISAGVACSLDFPLASGAQLLVKADEAMYEAKSSGRNNVKLAGALVTSPTVIKAGT